MMMLALLLTFSQVPPGPIDVFRANFASIKAEMDFRLTWGDFKGKDRLWNGKIPNFVEVHDADRDLTIVGHWACDGTSQYFNYGSPDEIIERASKDHLKMEAGKVFYKVLFIAKTEALWDGEILCSHQNHPHFMRRKANPGWQIINVDVVEDSNDPAVLSMGAGPFHFPYGKIFPRALGFFGTAVRERHRAMRWGHPTEVEAYRKDYPDGDAWERLEISYDPSIGYLPRFVRRLTWIAPKDLANCEETYLIEAQLCNAGGFVPTEWYSIEFEVPGFKKRFPNYSESTDFAPSSLSFHTAHFRASNFRDFKGPVALKELKDVHSITGIGGAIKRPVRATSLTLGDIKELLGEKLTTSVQRVLPSIDMAELRELDRPPSGAWWPYALGAVVVVLGLIGFSRWRRARLGLPVLLIAFLGASSGCGAIADPVIKLTAGYKETFVYVGPKTHELAMTLVVRNDGNRSVRVTRADGGCTCRQVDQSVFPKTIAPGKMIAVPVKLSIAPTTSPGGSSFQLDTDKGTIGVAATYFTLASHELTPENIINNLMYEADDWTFEVVHRQVYRADGAPPSFDLSFPDGFTVAKKEAKTGQVGGAPDYAYRETNYRATLNDRSLGPHRTSLVLKGPKDEILLESPVYWKRVPFLSSVPDRAILGTRPVRVFLRCPDENVELTKVLSAPKGIKAVVSSTRELTVMLSEHASGTIDGTVEVETTARGRPPLKVQVVRYQSPIVKRTSLKTGR